ncbi:hypothetical protein D3C72_1413120 [compost metagenome]
MPGRQRLRKGLAGRQVHVQVDRLGHRPCDRAGHAVRGARQHAHRGAVVQRHRRNLCRRQVPVPRRGHLVRGRQVQPQLEAFHAAVFLLGHFRVDHACACHHPLRAAVLQQPLVAGAVAMAHAASQHVGDGLEAAVRVIGEAADVVILAVGAEGIEHQERVQPALQVLRQHAGQLDAGAVGRGDAPHDAVHGARALHAFRGGGGNGGEGATGVHVFLL